MKTFIEVVIYFAVVIFGMGGIGATVIGFIDIPCSAKVTRIL